MAENANKRPVVLSVNELTKSFPGRKSDFLAVDQVSFNVHQGEIVGLLGPNGAGKTTTIQMLLGLMTPTSGGIHYFGLPFELHREEILKKLNHTSGYARMPWRLTVLENLNVYGWMYEVKNHTEKIAELVDAFEIKSFKNKRFQDLSAGQMTRVLLAKAFINTPELVLLDEPTASLDPDISLKIRNYILDEQKKRKMSLVITSHNMHEVEEMCDRVVFLNKGKVYAIDTPDGLAKKNQNCELQLMVRDGLKRLIEVIEGHGFRFSVSKRYIAITLPEQQVGALLSEMGAKGLQYSEIEIVKPSLEDFFVNVSKK
ncbi:MAG: ABC transporter ATP-binding protein [Patescibacteria group bacterium]